MRGAYNPETETRLAHVLECAAGRDPLGWEVTCATVTREAVRRAIELRFKFLCEHYVQPGDLAAALGLPRRAVYRAREMVREEMERAGFRLKKCFRKDSIRFGDYWVHPKLHAFDWYGFHNRQKRTRTDQCHARALARNDRKFISARMRELNRARDKEGTDGYWQIIERIASDDA